MWVFNCMCVLGRCCCIPLLYNHLMDSCSYLRKNTLLAAKGGCICTRLTPPKSTTSSPTVWQVIHCLNWLLFSLPVLGCLHDDCWGWNATLALSRHMVANVILVLSAGVLGTKQVVNCISGCKDASCGCALWWMTTVGRTLSEYLPLFIIIHSNDLYKLGRQFF